jgi:hypothetical protein
MKFNLLFSGLAILLAAGSLSAQDPPALPRKLRLMAVGDPPPFQQEYRNGVRHESEAPVGSIPPRQIEVLTGGEKSEPMKLALGETTTQIEVPGIATQVNLVVGGQVWHAINLPEGGDFLAILLRDPGSGKWDKARSVLIPEGTGKFDEGDVRFISLTGAPLRFQIKDGAAFEVLPGKAVTKKLGVASGIETLAQYRDQALGWKKLWSSALVQNRGERSTVLVYPAEGIKPRQPLTLIVLRERTAPAPAVAPPRPDKQTP